MMICDSFTTEWRLNDVVTKREMRDKTRRRSHHPALSRLSRVSW